MHRVQLHEIIGLAAWAYGVSGFDYWSGLGPRAVELAEGLLGPGCLQTRRGVRWNWQRGQRAALIDTPQARLPHVIRGTERRVIVLRKGLSREPSDEVEQAICHELAEWLLTDVARYQGEDAEDIADQLGDALLASQGAFRQAMSDLWPDLPAIGRVFGQDERWAASRYCLDGGAVAVVRGGEVAVKTGDFRWESDRAVLELAAAKQVPEMFNRELVRGRPASVVLWVP